MRLALDEKWTGRLSMLPESGMGYQRVRVRLRDGRQLADAIVLNAQVLQVKDGEAPFTAADIVAIDVGGVTG